MIEKAATVFATIACIVIMLVSFGMLAAIVVSVVLTVLGRNT